MAKTPAGRRKAIESKGSQAGFPIAPEVLERLSASLEDLTLKQRILGLYLLQHPEKICFLSIRELAEMAGVSIATVTRLCRSLGYSGYVELSRAFRNSLQYELSTPNRFKLALDTATETGADVGNLFDRILANEIDCLVTLRRSLRQEDVTKCIDWMAEADALLVVGSMGSTALAEYLAYGASKVHPMVQRVTTATGTIAWLQMGTPGPSTLVFLISFPRYQKSTVEVGQFLKRRGCRIVAITDHLSSPLASVADLVFPIPVSFSTVVDSFASVVAFLNGLIMQFSKTHPKMSQARLLEFEDYTKQMGIWASSPKAQEGGHAEADDGVTGPKGGDRPDRKATARTGRPRSSVG